MRNLSIATALTCALTFALSPLAAVAQDSRQAEPAGGGSPLDVAELRQQMARSLAAEGEKLLAAGDAAAAARKFQEAAGLAIETPQSPDAARRARFAAIEQKYARHWLARAEESRKAGRMLDAYRNAVQVLYWDPLDESARELAYAVLPKAVAEWRALWTRRMQGLPRRLRPSELPASGGPEPEADLAVWKRLQQPVVPLSFHGVKLVDVFENLRTSTKLNIRVKWPVLREAGMKQATPVHADLKDISLQNALQILLDEFSGPAGEEDRLGYVIENGVLTISTNADLARKTYDVLYDCRGLLGPPRPVRLPSIPDRSALQPPMDEETRSFILQQPWPDAVQIERIASILLKAIDEESWIEGDPVGACITGFEGVLTIRQNRTNHARIAELLGRLKCLLTPAEAQIGALPPLPNEAADGAVEKSLRANVPNISFRETRLEDAIDLLRPLVKGSMHVKWRSLLDAGVVQTRPITLQLHNVSVETALRAVLEEASGAAGDEDRLDVLRRGGVLLISTIGDLAKETEIVLYDVRDLIADAQARRALAQETGRLDLLARNSGQEEDSDDTDECVHDGHEQSGMDWDYFDEEETRRSIAYRLEEMLRRTIDPESWIEGSPTSGSIHEFEGIFIIKQTPRNHAQVWHILQKLREVLGPTFFSDSRPAETQRKSP